VPRPSRPTGNEIITKELRPKPEKGKDKQRPLKPPASIEKKKYVIALFPMEKIFVYEEVDCGDSGLTTEMYHNITKEAVKEGIAAFKSASMKIEVIDKTGDSRIAERIWQKSFFSFSKIKESVVLSIGKELGADLIITCLFAVTNGVDKIQIYLTDTNTGITKLFTDYTTCFGGGEGHQITTELFAKIVDSNKLDR
jgi:hypothetical protein